jgi:hypothetical protein
MPEIDTNSRSYRKNFEIKTSTKEEAMYIEDTQRLVTEIETLKVVLHLVSRGEEVEKGKKKEKRS